MTLHSLTRPLFVLGIRAACVGIAGSVAASAPAANTGAASFTPSSHPHVAAQSGIRPIQAALDLLKWPRDRAPKIEVVEVRPPQVSVIAEAWTVYNADGSAQPTIYVAGWSELYRAALANEPDVHHRVIRLAGVLAHERAHIEHGSNEELAYLAQLITMERLRASDIDLNGVQRALEAVRRQQRGRR